MENNGHNLGIRTKRFALDIIALYTILPKNTLAQVLGKQLLRAGTSVGANYCEADGARSKAEFIAKMGDCLKELKATAYWLDLLIASDTIRPELAAALCKETRELTAIFTTMIKRAKE